MCLASDTFQARKTLLIGSCLISMIGSGIAPGSQNIYRLIAAQALIGFGFAGVPLTYTVPSEILPRKWRPSKSLPALFSLLFCPGGEVSSSACADNYIVAQGLLSLAASMANISGPLIGGALITQNAQNGSVSNSGWRKYFVGDTSFPARSHTDSISTVDRIRHLGSGRTRRFLRLQAS